MKTPEMERIEFRDWERRLASDPQAKRRDIRDIIVSTVEEAGTVDAAATRIGVTASRLSVWINKNLGGRVRSKVVFPEAATQPERVAA